MHPRVMLFLICAHFSVGKQLRVCTEAFNCLGTNSTSEVRVDGRLPAVGTIVGSRLPVVGRHCMKKTKNIEDELDF